MIVQILSAELGFNLSPAIPQLLGWRGFETWHPPETASRTRKLLEWVSAWSSDTPGLGFCLFASARMLLMKRKSNVTHAGVDTQDIYRLIPKKCTGGAGCGVGGAGSSVRPPRIFATFPLTPRVMLAGEKRHHILAQGWRERVPLPGMVSPEREASHRRLPAEVCPRNIPEVAPGWGTWEPDCFTLVWRGGCQGAYHSALCTLQLVT